PAATGAAGARARAARAGAGRPGDVLRLRRRVLGEDGRDQRGDAAQPARRLRGDRRRLGGRRGRELPDAHRGRAAQARQRDADQAPRAAAGGRDSLMSISMSDVPLKERVNAALQNPDRLRAISSGAEAAFVKRNIVLESLPDSDATRDLARQIRAHAIAHLDRYLAEFEANLTANGGQVHWARDADEARQIVLDIATRVGAKRVAKSKSMVTEEIRLNAALEAQGIEVWETDLGEFIAQQ